MDPLQSFIDSGLIDPDYRQIEERMLEKGKFIPFLSKEIQELCTFMDMDKFSQDFTILIAYIHSLGYTMSFYLCWDEYWPGARCISVYYNDKEIEQLDERLVPIRDKWISLDDKNRVHCNIYWGKDEQSS